MAKSRYRHVVELYTTGEVKVLRDGTPMWVQILSPFEAQTARNEAQIARARRRMALREGSDEQMRIRNTFEESGRTVALDRLVDTKANKVLFRVIMELESDPDWKERLEILRRGVDGTASALNEDERNVVTEIDTEYTQELAERLENERQAVRRELEGISDDDLWEQYLESWLDQRGDDAAMAEYQLHQVLFGARVCWGTKNDDDTWDHAGCESHRERVFETKEEVRDLPEELVEAVLSVYRLIDMSEREAKNSDRQTSSSGSSPLPSGEGESIASTPEETPTQPPGTSPSPSATP